MDRASRIAEHLFGYGQQLPVCRNLSALPLRTSHALKPLHASASRPFSIAKLRHVRGGELTHPSDQPRENADGIPQQSPIGGPMDIALHHRRVDAEFGPIF